MTELLSRNTERVSFLDTGSLDVQLAEYLDLPRMLDFDEEAFFDALGPRAGVFSEAGQSETLENYLGLESDGQNTSAIIEQAKALAKAGTLPTVIISDLKTLGPVEDLRRYLSLALKCDMRAFAFWSPTGSTGPASHVDRRRTHVIQLQGEKTFDFYPLHARRRFWSGNVDVGRERPTQITLMPSQVISFPATLPHAAAAIENSTHVGFTQGYRGISARIRLLESVGIRHPQTLDSAELDLWLSQQSPAISEDPRLLSAACDIDSASPDPTACNFFEALSCWYAVKAPLDKCPAEGRLLEHPCRTAQALGAISTQ